MDDFYVHISSGTQSANNFTYHLPYTKTLNGKWKATLIDLQLPKVKNIVGSTLSVLKGKTWSSYTIPDGYYPDASVLNTALTALDAPLVIVERGNNVMVGLKRGIRVDAYNVSGSFASVLGVPENTVFRNLLGVDFDLERQRIIVECDIVEPDFIGTTKRNILTMGEPKKVKPLTTLDSINVAIKNFHGDMISFGYGETFLTLAFHKIE